MPSPTPRVPESPSPRHMTTVGVPRHPLFLSSVLKPEQYKDSAPRASTCSQYGTRTDVRPTEWVSGKRILRLLIGFQAHQHHMRFADKALWKRSLPLLLPTSLSTTKYYEVRAEMPPYVTSYRLGGLADVNRFALRARHALQESKQ
jgi:hypothetical protein